MNKAEFEAAVRHELRRVPESMRQTWNGTELFAWWMQTAQAHPSLVWEGCRGDPWRHVHALCRDLIGPQGW
jgi:hypothetical protein